MILHDFRLEKSLDYSDHQKLIQVLLYLKQAALFEFLEAKTPRDQVHLFKWNMFHVLLGRRHVTSWNVFYRSWPIPRVTEHTFN